MNKADLIEKLSVKRGLTDKQAQDVVKLMFGGFTETLEKGGRIEIRGFGSFSMRSYKPYTGRNPRSGGKVRVGSKRLPYFKAANKLKKRLMGKA